MWDQSFAATVPPWAWYAPRSNHANPDGTAVGENMLFGDGHVEWRPLNHGIGKDGDGTPAGSAFGNDELILWYK
jgi:hypothetical protein